MMDHPEATGASNASCPPVGIALLGASQILRNNHLRALRACPRVRVVGLASRREEKARAWREELGLARVWPGYQDAIDDPDVEAVLNTLPMSLHAEWVVKACEAGKHTLCEKPMALTVAEAERIRAAATANGVVVLEGFTHRYPPQMRYVRELLAGGSLGPVRLIRMEVLYTTVDWVNDTRARPELGGCVTIEAGCYAVDTLRWLMAADPVAVAGYSVQRNANGLETTFAGLMRFPGDRIGVMYTSMETAFRASGEVICEKGRIELPELFHGTRLRVVRVVDGLPVAEEVSFPAVDRFLLQLDHFCDCIRDGEKPMVGPEEALGNTRVLEALRAAGRAPVL